MPPEKVTPPSASHSANISIEGDVSGIVVAGDNNTVSQTVVQRITNFFSGGAEQYRAMRNRRAMLELVKNTWIKGVLEKSLYNEVLIELGMEERPSAVDHPWDTQVQMPNQTNRVLPTGTSVMAVFDEMNGAMLILGEPGSGKTTLLLELARDCIARAQQDDNQPIPVIFNLSSWDGKQPLDVWLMNELNSKYSVPKKTAQALVANDELHLLLDGLDEVKPGIRDACVKAINDFREKHGLLIPIAVCSRIADYEALTAKLNLSGALLLSPLTPKQIDEYFHQAGPELDGVHQILKNDEILQEMVKQPLILSVMTLAYQGMSAEMIVSEGLDTPETRRKHLFDTYIQQMFGRVARTKNEKYTPEQTKHWLSWLAQKMIAHNQVPYLIEGMQINWLNLKSSWYYRLMNSLLAGSLIGLIIGLINGIIGGITFFQNNQQFFEATYKLGPGLIMSLIGALIYGLIIGLFYGLAVGLISGLFTGIALKTNKIEMVDTLTWDWKQGFLGFIAGEIIGGIILGSSLFAFGLLTGTSTSTDGVLNLIINWVFDVLLMGFVWGLAGGLFGFLIKGFTVKPVNQTSYPGQKIFSSIKSFFFVLLLFVLFFGVSGSIAAWLFDDVGLLNSWVQIGLFLGYIGGLMFGGGALIQHYILRFNISIRKLFPWKLVLFLDYCAERIFLRKVGGGYIFVHRLLMEHFAAMYPEET